MRSLLVVTALLVSGCAHSIAIESNPSGADVYVAGEAVGKTPLDYRETSEHEDLIPVEVKSGTRSAHFAIHKTGISTEAAIGACVGAAGACALGAAGISSIFLVPIAIAGGPDPVTGIGIILGAYAAYIGGAVLISFAPYIAVVGIGEGSRIGPDQINVDFTSAEVPVVKTNPPNMMVPLVGHTAGPQRF